MWRVERPEIDREICTRCGLCFVGCPEGAISLDGQHYPVIDYDHCKGCMLCAHLCPLQGIIRKKEVRAW
jgi:2-oxoacid:acceptor oxidoreductase delta subunit (pyruvate/2-ketoisovalerate family)